MDVVNEDEGHDLNPLEGGDAIFSEKVQDSCYSFQN